MKNFELEKKKLQEQKLINDNEDNLYRWSNSAAHINMDYCLIEMEKLLIDKQLKYNSISGGFEIVDPKNNNAIFIWYTSGKWRMKGKNKYYRSSSAESFINKYVLRNI